MSDPLVHTSKGNLPVAECEHYIEWNDMETTMVFTEWYVHEGETVRKDVHVYAKQGLSTEVAQPNL